jgi:flavodoxin
MVTAMRIEYFHASKWGNGEKVALEFKRQMVSKGVTVNVHHIKDSKPKEMPSADLYVFSSGGRMGGPRWCMKRFMKKARLPPGTKYAILTTEGAPKPDPKTGKLPDPKEMERWQRVIPKMSAILDKRGFVKIADGKVLVNEMKGPLEEGWEKKVSEFVERIIKVR